MSKIFGELLMLIEADYRETTKTTLAYNGLRFSVPKRLHIIGMMNTADRSLAMIDYALRRRFSFFDMAPGFDSEGFIKYQEAFANDTFNTLIDRIKELNREIANDKSLGKGFCIGHSYFCNTKECTDEWMQDVVDFDILPMLAESFDEMYNLLTAILAKGIGLQLKQGLYREYISHQEELTVMRGKINMPGTIKNKLLHKQVLTCDFDELSENNMLNQILKTTVMLLLRNGKVKAKYKDDLKKKMLYFSNVDSIEPTEIKWSSIRFQRNNQTYRMLVSICQLIIEGVLLYAKTEEEIQPDNVYQMHGSQISVKTLDLNLPFVEIAAQMDRIVESHFTGVIKAD